MFEQPGVPCALSWWRPETQSVCRYCNYSLISYVWQYVTVCVYFSVYCTCKYLGAFIDVIKGLLCGACRSMIGWRWKTLQLRRAALGIVFQRQVASEDIPLNVWEHNAPPPYLTTFDICLLFVFYLLHLMFYIGSYVFVFTACRVCVYIYTYVYT